MGWKIKVCGHWKFDRNCENCEKNFMLTHIKAQNNFKKIGFSNSFSISFSSFLFTKLRYLLRISVCVLCVWCVVLFVLKMLLHCMSNGKPYLWYFIIIYNWKCWRKHVKSNFVNRIEMTRTLIFFFFHI